MHWLRSTLITIAIGASTAAPAQPAQGIDIRNLEAAQKRWAQASLQNYKFTFRYSEFISPCKSWELDVRVSHGIAVHRDDCRKYRAKFSTVPLLFKYLRSALAHNRYVVEAEFDPKTGYPIKAYVGAPEISDDYFSFEIIGFSAEW